MTHAMVYELLLMVCIAPFVRSIGLVDHCDWYDETKKQLPTPDVEVPTHVKLVSPSTSLVEVVDGSSEALACFNITNTESEINLQMKTAKCVAPVPWQHAATWKTWSLLPKFWYSLVVTAEDNVISLSHNGRSQQKFSMQLRNDPEAIRLVERGSANFPLTHMENHCPTWQSDLECQQKKRWTTIMVDEQDTVRVQPRDGQRTQVRASLSPCFNNNRGESRLVGTGVDWHTLSANYSRDAVRHVLTVDLDGETLINIQEEHRGNDCSGRYIEMGIKGGDVTLNCNPNDESSAMTSHISAAMLISTILMTRMFI